MSLPDTTGPGHFVQHMLRDFPVIFCICRCSKLMIMLTSIGLCWQAILTNLQPDASNWRLLLAGHPQGQNDIWWLWTDDQDVQSFKGPWGPAIRHALLYGAMITDALREIASFWVGCGESKLQWPFLDPTGTGPELQFAIQKMIRFAWYSVLQGMLLICSCLCMT